MTKEQKRFLIHEASHAVMAVATGFPFLFLAQMGDGFGQLQLLNVSKKQLQNKEFCKGYRLICVAGAVGESIAGFTNGGLFSLYDGMGSQDMKNFSRAATNLVDVLFTCGAATDYLKQNWKAVERLAAALEEKCLMSESDVKATVGDLPRFGSKPASATPAKKRFIPKERLMPLVPRSFLSHCAVSN